VHELDQTSHVVHWVRGAEDRPRQRRVLHALERASELQHPHILPIEAFSTDNRGLPWCVTPFTGDHTGILALDRLLRLKGGFLATGEAKRAIDQLLEASVFAHERGHRHGPLTMSEVHVDRRGSLSVELYGLAHLLCDEPAPEPERLEVNAISRIGYQLLTGLRVELPIIRPSRVIENLDPSWDGWFENALGEQGFASAAHAHSALQDLRVSGDAIEHSTGRVRSTIKSLIFTDR
jgi:hypothetical protein